MIPIIPIVTTVVTFSAATWVVNKLVERVTGRDIDGNLDAATDKVLAFVRKEEPPAE